MGLHMHKQATSWLQEQRVNSHVRPLAWGGDRHFVSTVPHILALCGSLLLLRIQMQMRQLQVGTQMSIAVTKTTFSSVSPAPSKSPENTASFLDANGRPKHVVCPKGCVHEYRSARALRTLAALQKDTSTPSKRGAQLHATFAHTVAIQMDLVMFFGGQGTVFSTLER